MRQVFVENATIGLFIDSLCETMTTEPQRIIESYNGSKFADSKTNVFITIKEEDDGKEKWVLHIPDSKSFILGQKEIKKLTEGINDRENILLLEKHKELYSGKNDYKLFVAIQNSREESEMVEDAYQNLLTVYALNMDGDKNVS